MCFDSLRIGFKEKTSVKYVKNINYIKIILMLCISVHL